MSPRCILRVGALGLLLAGLMVVGSRAADSADSAAAAMIAKYRGLGELP